MKYSLTKRLTYRIMAVVLVMMAVITGIVHFTVRSYMLQEAQERYEGILLRDHEEFRRRLSDVMVATKNNIDNIERDIDSPDKLLPQLERMLQVNVSIVTSAILYEPGYFPDKKRCVELYATRDSVGGIHTYKDEDDYNEYMEWEWFKKSMADGVESWSEAYFEDSIIPNTSRQLLLTTFSIPIHQGKQRRPVALLCSDLPLTFLSYEMMDDLQELNKKLEKGSTHHSYNFVIDHNGTYIIHPDEKRIQTANFFDEARLTTHRIDDEVVTSMKDGEMGSAMVEIDGVPSWIYYRNVKHMDWVIAIVVPEEVIFHNGRILNTVILLVVFVGLLAIYFICRRAIKNTTATIENDLSTAEKIQMAMLPKTFPPYPERTDIDIYASVTPAREVGGDLYDYFLRDDRLFFCVGDVSGKGMPAALMMAVMRAMFRSETRRNEHAAAIVDTMNRNLSEEYTAGLFVTMFVGVLDLRTGHLDYCNAGHEAPFIVHSLKFKVQSSSTRVEASKLVAKLDIKPNLPVGALADWNYEGQETQLNPGDMLFLYTDGLSEAQNAQGQQLGRQRVQQLCEGVPPSPPEESVGHDRAQQLVELMDAEVHRHMGGAEQSDDITLMAIRWEKDNEKWTKLTMKSSMDDIGRLEPFVSDVARQAGISEKETKRLRLAVEESVANIINHGHATEITLRATVEDVGESQPSASSPQPSAASPQPSRQLLLVIDDDGLPFDPTEDSTTDLSIPPDQRPPGGLGIMLLHQMTDGLDYQRIDGHNILSIRKNAAN